MVIFNCLTYKNIISKFNNEVSFGLCLYSNMEKKKCETNLCGLAQVWISFESDSRIWSHCIFAFSIYQSNRYLFSRALIGFRYSRYPRLLVDFEAEVKMTESTRSKNRKKVYILLFLWKRSAFLSHYFGKY